MSGEISARCVHTTDSIPQGDPAAMAAMSVLLLCPTLRILKIPAPITLTVYADDRNAVARTREGMQSVQRCWDELES
eukprot:13848129-Alexandrium_andersonii.AAC.1